MKKMEIIKYRRQFCQFILLMCVVFFMTYASFRRKRSDRGNRGVV